MQVSPVGIWGNSISGRGNSTCKKHITTIILLSYPGPDQWFSKYGQISSIGNTRELLRNANSQDPSQNFSKGEARKVYVCLFVYALYIYIFYYSVIYILQNSTL